mgnify:CR=1 FL=1
MATHFKGPLLFSAQRPALQNLNTSMWPDQYYYMDDFGTGAVDENNSWTVIKDTGASVTVGDSATGELLLNSTATTDDDGASIQQKAETFSTPSIVGDSLWLSYKEQLKLGELRQLLLLITSLYQHSLMILL